MVSIFPRKPATVKEAKTILANPSNYLHRPHIFMVAWSILKTARGQTVKQRNINSQFQTLGDDCNRAPSTVRAAQ